MIKITIYKNQEEEYVGFQCKGHAGYDESGQDIVCAAVSILVLNTVNSIEKFTYDKFKCEAEDETGFIDFMFHSEPSSDVINASVISKAELRSVSSTRASQLTEE